MFRKPHQLRSDRRTLRIPKMLAVEVIDGGAQPRPELTVDSGDADAAGEPAARLVWSSD
jgi:hypothetical protein